MAVIVLPVLCFVSGHRWENDFGPAAPVSSALKIAAALLLCLVAIPVSHWAIFTYFHTRYLLAGGAF
jgi:hypothetical protein